MISQGITQARQEVCGQTSAGLTVGTGARAGSVRGVQGAQGEDLADNLAAGTMGVEHLGYVTLTVTEVTGEWGRKGRTEGMSHARRAQG